MDDYDFFVSWTTAVIFLPWAGFRLLAALYEVVSACRRKPLSQDYGWANVLFYFCATLALVAALQRIRPFPEPVRTYILAACGIAVACDIIRGVVLRYSEWRERQVKAIHRTFMFFDRLCERSDVYADRFKLLAGIALLLILAIGCFDPSSGAIALLAAACLALLLLWSVLK